MCIRLIEQHDSSLGCVPKDNTVNLYLNEKVFFSRLTIALEPSMALNSNNKVWINSQNF